MAPIRKELGVLRNRKVAGVKTVSGREKNTYISHERKAGRSQITQALVHVEELDVIRQCKDRGAVRRGWEGREWVRSDSRRLLPHLAWGGASAYQGGNWAWREWVPLKCFEGRPG